MFEIRDLVFDAGGQRLLGPVSLDIPSERVTGLLGHNGSGKSTLMRILARQYSASQGHVQFDGAPLQSLPSRAFARQVAYLPQEPGLAEALTVRELVTLGRYPWKGPLGRYTAEDRDIVEAAMADTDVLGLAERQVPTLSGGERQRVWLAHLLAQQTRALLLDEPISALDLAHQADMLGLIQRLCHERQLTVLIILHDVNMASRYCEHLLALRDGRICAAGTPTEIMDPNVLQRIFSVPMGVFENPDGHVIGYVR